MVVTREGKGKVLSHQILAEQLLIETEGHRWQSTAEGFGISGGSTSRGRRKQELGSVELGKIKTLKKATSFEAEAKEGIRENRRCLLMLAQSGRLVWPERTIVANWFISEPELPE